MNLWLVLTEISVAFGGLLFLLSAGFSLIFGLMRIPNLTHGSLFTLGANFGTSLIAAAFGFWPAAIATGTGSPPGALSRTLPQQGAGLPTGSDPTEFAGLDTPAVLAADGNGSVTARSNGSGCTNAGRTSRRQFRHIHPRLRGDANDRGHPTCETHGPRLFGPPPDAGAR